VAFRVRVGAALRVVPVVVEPVERQVLEVEPALRRPGRDCSTARRARVSLLPSWRLLPSRKRKLRSASVVRSIGALLTSGV
jgi:hypothetical protein